MPSLVSDLTAMLEPARVLHSREDLLAYGYDGTAALSGAGAAVVMVRSTDEIVSVVKYAAANRIPIVEVGGERLLMPDRLHGSVCHDRPIIAHRRLP